MGKIWQKFGEKPLSPARKALELSRGISEQISEKTSETSFQSSHIFSETLFSRRAMLRFKRIKGDKAKLARLAFFFWRGSGRGPLQGSVLVLWGRDNKEDPLSQCVLVLERSVVCP